MAVPQVRPDMTDEEILAVVEQIRADPGIARVLATAPRELSPNEAARIARLLWPRDRGSSRA